MVHVLFASAIRRSHMRTRCRAASANPVSELCTNRSNSSLASANRPSLNSFIALSNERRSASSCGVCRRWEAKSPGMAVGSSFFRFDNSSEAYQRSSPSASRTPALSLGPTALRPHLRFGPGPVCAMHQNSALLLANRGGRPAGAMNQRQMRIASS